MKKFKVIGSHTIQAFYSKVFEISEVEILKNVDLTDYITELALEDQSENLESWCVDYEENIGGAFYIEEIIPIND